MSDAVRVEIADGVAVVTVDNPPVNTLGDAVLEAFGDVASRLATDGDVRAVVLTGAGDKAFMAGADLAEFQRLLDGEGSIEDHVDTSRRALGLLEAIPQPVVAAVQASAMGGGLEVALVCDLIVADPEARLGLPEVRLGLMPGRRRHGPAAGADRDRAGPRAAPARPGRHRGGGPPPRSRQPGVGPGAALAEAVELAARLAALPARAVTSIKRVLAADHADALDRERAAFLELFHTEDVREGVAAFVEKRPPSFTHR